MCRHEDVVVQVLCSFLLFRVHHRIACLDIQYIVQYKAFRCVTMAFKRYDTLNDLGFCNSKMSQKPRGEFFMRSPEQYPARSCFFN